MNIETQVSVEVSIKTNGDTPHKDAAQYYDPFMSNTAREVLEIIFYCILVGVVSVLGSAANVINIIIFMKLGFKDTTNISLFGLSLSDLLLLLTLSWTSVCNNPLFQNSDIGFDPLEVEYVTAGWPQACLYRVTSWITAFITLERCVCVALPMKVKNIMTTKKTLISVVAIFVTMLALLSPEFFTVNFVTSFNRKLNKTLVGISYASNNPSIRNITISVNIIAQLGSFIVVIVCTAVLVLNLLVKSQWRLKVSYFSGNSDSMSLRDKRVMKMVTCIACIFIFCYFPTVINLILMVHFSSEYNTFGRYHNSLKVSWAIFNTLEAVNSSVTIFVYYNMSSKFRAAINDLLCTETRVGTVIDKSNLHLQKS